MTGEAGFISSIIYIIMGLIGMVSTIVFFDGLGLSNQADVFTEYVDHSGLTNTIYFLGILIYLGIDWNIKTYFEVFDDNSAKAWRVKQTLTIAGVSVDGLLSIGLALMSWSYLGSPTQPDPSSGGTYSGGGGGGGGYY